MSRKKHIVIVKLFDSGGVNTHFKTLIHYLGAENVILILENQQQRDFLQNLELNNCKAVYVMPYLHRYAHLAYRPTTNIRESLLIIRSLIQILWLSIINQFATITVSAAEPEKYLYLFWLPFSKVFYILHSEPMILMSHFTRFTCNLRLGRRKKIITVSYSMKQAICSAWRLRQSKAQSITVIYNCLLKDFFPNTDLKKSSSKKFRITTMGHVDNRKNPSTWLKVAKLVTVNHPQTEFIWLGNGALLEEYQCSTASLDRIIFAGKVEYVQAWLEETTIYYQPSVVEPHGIAVVEAMSAGLPCIVAETGGLPESVQEGIDGKVVKPIDVEVHVSAIEQLLENEFLRQIYGKNARKRYVNLFSYPQFKEKMDRIYC
ncbi:glycosyltransferase family 4 protein [Mucilaginibacter aquaedulcis]|uniref:glycosyltransferase family 4 protein n=1 Tax=Mucilaginibacter aquaedulcis TaxID=1187081 RepID=UPI0025B5A50B|nr:glycosyltransferase family 4 protein [Mucilaginibacter aquaedulcis]MDN3548725.1 glycosyltransferase family 4 protein [Mucilaginibacter aquaedulcis]